MSWIYSDDHVPYWIEGQYVVVLHMAGGFRYANLSLPVGGLDRWVNGYGNWEFT